MSKCRLYLVGLPNFNLVADHRPWIPILRSYMLDTVENPRLQCLKGISPYVFTAVWCAGKNLSIPDVLSCTLVRCPTPEDETMCTEAAAHVRSLETIIVFADQEQRSLSHQGANWLLEELQVAARVDPDYCRLLDCITSGFPVNRYSLHDALLPYWKFHDSLYAYGDLVLYSQRIVIPIAHRRHTLACP